MFSGSGAAVPGLAHRQETTKFMRLFVLCLVSWVCCLGVLAKADFLKSLRAFHQKVNIASREQLLDEIWLATSIGEVGLYSEGDRRSAEDPTRPVHGDESVLQMATPSVGVRAIPRQLAGMLIELALRGGVKSMTFWGMGSGEKEARSRTMVIISQRITEFTIEVKHLYFIILRWSSCSYFIIFAEIWTQVDSSSQVRDLPLLWIN